jgi:hypothetical protein
VSPEELERAVVALQDRQAIQDVLMTYSRGIDRLDRELLLSVYHDDAIDDHGVFVGSPEEFADWAIAARVCVRAWAALTEAPAELDQSALRVVKGLDERVQHLLRTGAQPARDRSDASYDRPLTIDETRAERFREVA